MAMEEKKYLDYAGLSKYDELIKAYIKTHGSDVTDKLVALVGAAEKGADEKTILARIADLETAVGDVSELGEEVENLVKAIVGEKTRAEGAESDLQDAIDALIEKLYGSGEGEEHVDGDLDKINAAIAAEQERAEGAEGDIMDFIGEIPEDAEAETVIGYVDAKVAEINGDAEALEERVEALEATHATNEDGSFKTVGEEVNEAVTALIDGAPEALDTLKEIADWIAEQGETDEDGVTQLVSKIEKNAQAIADEKERAEDAESDLSDRITALEEDTSDADAVKALEEKLYGTGEGEEHVKGDIDEIQSTIDADEKNFHDVIYGTESDGQGGFTGGLQSRIEDLESAVDKNLGFIRITDTEINALFGIEEEPNA